LAQGEAPSLVIAAYRLLLATFILAVPALYRAKEEIRALKFLDWLLIMLSGLFLAIHFGSWVTSLAYTSIASSVVIVTSSPLWVALFSPLLLKERVPIPVRWGLGVAMVGALLVGSAEVVTGGNNLIGINSLRVDALWGQFLAFIGAVFVAGYLIIGRKMRQTVSLLTYSFLVYGIAAILLTLLVIILGLPMTGYQPQTYLLFAGMAIFPQLLGHSTLNWALKYLPAAVIAITTLWEPVGATLLGFFILHESPHYLEIIGGGIIPMGIFITSRGNQSAISID
jgi:drug/metabolite transporter (DMT)-like permease